MTIANLPSSLFPLPFSLSLLFLLLVLAGCLPSSCRREASRALFASDSLSRQVAAQTPVDTLRLLWQTSGPEEQPLASPRTVRFGPRNRLYVSDAKRNSIFAFTEEGRFAEAITAESFDVPYLAGFRGDTLLVFSPGAQHIDFVVEGTPVRRLPTLPDEGTARGRLHYAAASGDAIYVKLIGEDVTGYIARLDERGAVIERHVLPGPYWRHAGLLHFWGDSLLSLSGYRPVVDVIAPGTPLDTLPLLGFDSPMLARSRAFMLGEASEPPLLSATAAAAGDLLFVLNMRPGWLRVDAYDRAGRLQRVLIQDNPAYNRQFYPVDLAARRRADGSYDLAVITVKPRPQLALFHSSIPPLDVTPSALRQADKKRVAGVEN